MSEEIATLADTLVSPSAEPATATTPEVAPSGQPEAAAAAPPPSEIVPAIDKDAAEIGRVLLDSGFSKDQLNELMNAPRVLEQIRYQIENDPREFIRAVERANPKAGEKLLDELSDLYVDRYGEKDGKAAKPAAAAGGEVEALRARLERLEAERTQERQQANIASTRQRYQGRVDDLFGLKEVKELGLTKSEQRAMRAALDVELGKDQGATQRIVNGNFVDVPKTFKGILDEWVADKRTTAEAVKATREQSEANSFYELTNGPNPLTKLPTDTFDSWDKTEDAFAKMLERAK